MKRAIVLFVDDDVRVLKAWRRSFQTELFQMVFATSGREALSILDQQDVSVVVSDYAMLNGDGIELLSAINQRTPQIARILVSGHATLKLANQAINSCSVFKLFQKPCNAQELSAAIKEALGIGEVELKELQALEREYPGISRVRRGFGGGIEV